jgi:hypothetical protein
MSETTKQWKPTEEAKGKATQLRIFAGLLWIIAIIAQVIAIRMVLKDPNENLYWIIGLIVLELALVLFGSSLWKKAGRLDPPSEKNKFLFYLQSQLGVVAAVVAFLPLVIFILSSKKMDGKNKAILGSIAGVALLIAGIGSADFNPPSVEKYTEETSMVEALMGENKVHWTQSGGKYHLYEDCGYIKNSETKQFGKVSDAYQTKGINELCSRCKNRKIKEDNIDEESLNTKVKSIKERLESKDEPTEEKADETKEAA